MITFKEFYETITGMSSGQCVDVYKDEDKEPSMHFKRSMEFDGLIVCYSDIFSAYAIVQDAGIFTEESTLQGYYEDFVEDGYEIRIELHNADSFNISRLSREDLEAIGFDTSDVDDKTMEELAGKLGDDYCTQLFWDSLEIIADIMGIPRKDDDESEDDDF